MPTAVLGQAIGVIGSKVYVVGGATGGADQTDKSAVDKWTIGVTHADPALCSWGRFRQ
jgi:hypothetical protein